MRTLILLAGEPVPPAAEDRHAVHQPSLGAAGARRQLRTRRRAMLAEDVAHSRCHRRLRTTPASQTADARTRAPPLVPEGAQHSAILLEHQVSG